MAVITGRHQVAGQLFANELVVGFISIKGINHVIAVAPGMRIGEVDVLAAGFGVACDIQPVASPAFPETFRSQQSVHQFLISPGVLVIYKSLHFLRCGRHTVQIKKEPANQGAPIGLGGRLQGLLLQAGQNKAVDIRASPVILLHLGNSGLLGSLKGPVVPGFFPIRFFDRRVVFARVGCAHHDPLFKVGNNRLGQLFLGRHFQILILVTNGFDQQTFLQFSRDHGVARFAALTDAHAGIEHQFTLQLLAFS